MFPLLYVAARRVGLVPVAIAAAAVIAVVLDRRHVQPGQPTIASAHDLAGAAAQQDAAFMARTTRSVAHDLRNVFQVVNSCAVDLYGEMHGRRAGVLVLEILNAAERGLGVTTELARAGRDRPDDDRPVDLRLLSRELEPILRRLAASSVSIDIDCVSTGVFVRIDRTSVMQILMNLVDNAAEAMGRMGRISIYVGRDVRHTPGRASEHVAVMTVTDDGPGMPSDVVAKVFDVGFSTKEGHHAGLGLSVVHSVVQRHQGHIWVSSEPGVGTSFRIELPLVERDDLAVGVGERQTHRADPRRAVAGVHMRRGRALREAEALHDARTTRHPGYRISTIKRKRIEEPFGWMKTVGGLRKTRHRGRDLVEWFFVLTAAAYNLIRIPKILAATG